MKVVSFPPAMKRLIIGRVVLPIAALGVIVSVAAFSAGSNPVAQSRPNTASSPAGDLEVLQIRPNFYLIAGAGGTIAAQVGSDSFVCWSTQVWRLPPTPLLGRSGLSLQVQFDTSSSRALTRIASAATRMVQDAHRERQGLG
jgi:hypothetical protein